MSAPTCEECQDVLQEPAQHSDSPLPALNVDSSSLKRTFSCDEEGVELVSPVKRPKLEDKNMERNNNGGRQHEVAITKIADSPMPVKDEPLAVQEVCMEHENEAVKLKGLKIEQECIEKETGKLELGRLFCKPVDKDTEKNIDNQTEVSGTTCKDGKQEEELQIVFSEEEDEGGANGGHVTSGRMLSSQMNRQIDRVQVFLKLERLKRPKK